MGTLGHLLLIAVAYAIVNNVVLSQFLGICPFLGVSKNTKTAAGMGIHSGMLCTPGSRQGKDCLQDNRRQTGILHRAERTENVGRTDGRETPDHHRGLPGTAGI